MFSTSATPLENFHNIYLAKVFALFIDTAYMLKRSFNEIIYLIFKLVINIIS